MRRREKHEHNWTRWGYPTATLRDLVVRAPGPFFVDEFETLPTTRHCQSCGETETHLPLGGIVSAARG